MMPNDCASEIDPQAISIINHIVDDNPDTATWIKTAHQFYLDGNEKAIVSLLEKGSVQKSTTRNIEENKKAKLKAVTLCNILSSFYIAKLANESNPEQREDYAQKTTTFINQAENISNQDTKTWLNKGFGLFLAWQTESAKLHFDNILETEADNIEALYGKACVLYFLQNYSDCLACYQKMLSLNRKTNIKVRLGIALCLFKLGDHENAKKAINRHLQLYPNDDTGESFSGVMHILGYLRSGNAHDLSTALTKFYRALHINPSNELALYYVALHQFIKGDITKSEKLITNGISLLDKYGFSAKEGSKEIQYPADISKLSSAMHTLNGRINQMKESIQVAQREYQIAISMYKDNYHAAFRLGQIAYHMKSYTDSYNYLHPLSAIEKYSSDIGLNSYLGYCYMLVHKKAEAITYLKKILQNNEEDINALITICQITESEQKEEAKVYYSKIIQITKLDSIHTKEDVQNSKYKEVIENAGPEILNNYACILLNMGYTDDAKTYIKYAIEIITSHCISIAQMREAALLIIMQYNRAYCYEMKGCYADASNIYKSIISNEPTFMSAYVRLANMAIERGDIKKMNDYIKKGIDKQGSKSNAAKSQLAYNFLQAGNYKSSSNLFQEIIKDTKGNDKYAQISVANIAYDYLKNKSISVFHNSSNINREELEIEYKKILSQYSAVLIGDEKNIYAAIGVANILSEFGKYEEATEIYRIIREKDQNIPAAWINSANIEASNGRYVAAASIYKRCLEKYFPMGDYDIEMILSKCYLANKNYSECTKILISLYVKYPNKIEIQYNLGVCSQLQAFSILSHTTQSSTNISKAQELIKTAIMLFDSIHSGDIRIRGRFNSFQDLGQISAISSELCKGAAEKKIIAEDQLKKSSLLIKKATEREHHIEEVGKEISQKELISSISKPTNTSQQHNEDKELKEKLAKLNEEMKKMPLGKPKLKRKKADKEEKEKTRSKSNEEIKEGNEDANENNVLDIDEEIFEDKQEQKEEAEAKVDSAEPPKHKRLKKENAISNTNDEELKIEEQANPLTTIVPVLTENPSAASVPADAVPSSMFKIPFDISKIS